MAEQPPSASPDSVPPAPSADALIDQSSIDELLKQASFEDPASFVEAAAAAAGARPGAGGSSGVAEVSGSMPDTAGFKLPNFQQVMQDAQVSSIDLLRDVELNVKIELGRSRMLVEDVLKLSEGSVVELDKLAGDPVDVFVNDRLVARGEVLVLNDNFCVRVNEIVAGVKEEGL
jgi:flagellar motor switch protein FliN/FliY